jgi:hypothetical protein
MWIWREDGRVRRSKRSRKQPRNTTRRPRRSHRMTVFGRRNARRSRSHEHTRSPICSAPARPRIVRCWNKQLPTSIGGWRRWKIPKPKSQNPNPKKNRRVESPTANFQLLTLMPLKPIPRAKLGLWALGFGLWDLLPSPLRRLARGAPTIAPVASVGELFERKAVIHQRAFQFRLARRARRTVVEFVRGLRVPRPVHEQARAPFGR